MPTLVRHVIVPATNYYSKPCSDSGVETQIPFGHDVLLVGNESLCNFVQIDSPLYGSPGYVLARDLGMGSAAVTHHVLVPSLNVYQRPSFKSSLVLRLPMSARVRLIGGASTPEGNMSQLEYLGWVFSEQIALTPHCEADYVDVARRFVGRSYMWGGIVDPDCSALVMLALHMCGIACPRNVGEQVKVLGKEVDFQKPYFQYQRGDLVFWTDPTTKGRHVVIMIDADTCVHSTIAIPHRGVVEQPLHEVIADQLRDGNGMPTVVRRM